MKIKLILVILIMQICTTVWAGDRYPFTHPNEEIRFNQLITQFRCLVCQNEDLASSNAALAFDLRQQIYQMVVQGKSDTAITQYMVNRYGDFVLFKPPVMAKTIFIWVLPFLLLMVGFTVFYFVIKKYRA